MSVPGTLPSEFGLVSSAPSSLNHQVVVCLTVSKVVSQVNCACWLLDFHAIVSLASCEFNKPRSWLVKSYIFLEEDVQGQGWGGEIVHFFIIKQESWQYTFSTKPSTLFVLLLPTTLRSLYKTITRYGGFTVKFVPRESHKNTHRNAEESGEIQPSIGFGPPKKHI